MKLSDNAKKDLKNVFVLFQNGDIDNSLLLIDDLDKKYSQSEIIKNNYGVILSQIGRQSDSILYFKKAIFINNKYISAYNNLISTLSSLGKNNEAINYLKELEKIKPLDFNTPHNIAQNLFKLKKYHESIIYFNKSIDLNKNCAEVYNNLGTVYFVLNNTQKALNYYLEAVSINSNYVEAQCNVGIMLNLLQRYEESLVYLNEAIKLSPSFADAYQCLASSYNSLDKKDKALINYKKLLELKPNNDIAKHMINSLSGITPSKPPDSYIIELFDAYSNKFEDDVTLNLKYNIPYKLKELFNNFSKVNIPLDRAIDLGCGTGLCGEQFKDIVREIIGIDLSSSMLLKASQKLIYSSLIENDLINGLRSITQKQDLFISADVFIYIGDLEKLFLEITKKCHQNSFFIFSIESLESDESIDFLLKETGRYGHSNQYIKNLSSKHNFSIITKSSVEIRKHKSKWIPGSIYLLRYNNQ